MAVLWVAAASLLCTVLSIHFSHSSCQQESFVGLNQQFNTSNATDGSSITALQDPTGNYVLSFNNEGQAAPPYYNLLISTQGTGIAQETGSYITVIVWTANVEAIKGNCTLRLQQDGNLVLLDYNLTVYWQTNTSDQGVVTMALLDTGNLVLLDAKNSTVWQSFDHPTDTLILGQRLTAGVSMLQHGLYSLGIHDSGLYLFYSAGGQLLPYWQLYPSSSPADTNSSSAAVALAFAEVTRDAIQLFAYNNASAMLGSIPLPPFTNASADDNQSWWLLKLDDNSGFLNGSRANSSHYQTFSLPAAQADQLCAFPNVCGGPYHVCDQDSGNCSSCPLVIPPSNSNSYAALDPGCELSALPYPNCSTEVDVAEHRFLNLSGFTYFAVGFNVSILSASLEECADECLRNCSCKAAFYVTTTSSCLHVSELSNLINASGKTDHLAFIKYQLVSVIGDLPAPAPAPAPATAPLPSGQTHRPTTAVRIIGGVVGTMTALLVIISFWLLWRKRRKGARKEATDDDETFLGTLSGLPSRFSFKDLKACTNNFSRKLGAGGFGAVYEGVNPRDKLKPVAVKRLEGMSRHGSRQFLAEIVTIGSIRHLNLVRLHGFCMEGSHRLLVYELMSNGSLDTYLRNPRVAAAAAAAAAGDDPQPLPWTTRFGIALGTARGLAYLHDECQERIIHCDIKPENILLNHRLEPAISDFGLAKLMSREQSYAATTMRGTRGYLAPEWVRNAPITEKSDVYSYGMVLLELVSGRRLLDAHAAISERRHLPEWAMSLSTDHHYDRGRAAFKEMIDERLVIGTATMEEDVQAVEDAACQVIAISLLCIQEDPDARPSMATVVKMLQGDVQVPAILPSTSITSSYSLSCIIPASPSHNQITMSSVNPR